jgi:hypothetical protein
MRGLTTVPVNGPTGDCCIDPLEYLKTCRSAAHVGKGFLCTDLMRVTLRTLYALTLQVPAGFEPKNQADIVDALAKLLRSGCRPSQLRQFCVRLR